MQLKPLGSDISDFDSLVKVMEKILAHRKANPTVPSSVAFYEAQCFYYRRIRHAREEGRPLILHSAFSPVEILYAMDLVPAHASFSIGAVAQVLKKQPEYLEAGQRYGLPWELCGGHRVVVGGAILGKLPHFDACISYHMGCTNAATSVVSVAQLYNLPIFYLQLPFGYRESDLECFVRQLRELIPWLERVTGRKMDWDKLKETVRIEKQVYELEREIEKYREVIPSPMKHRSYMEQYQTDMMLAGTPQSLHYYQTLRDEIKGFVENGIHPLGPDHKERYRIISCFMPPNWCRSLLDWMEEELGISSVAEPHMNEWSASIADQIDPDRPLESLGLKYQNHLIIRLMCAPMMVNQLPDTLKHVKKRKVDGAIYYASVTCNTSPHLLTCLKDALEKQAKIPMLVLDNDVLDPQYVGEGEMRDRVEGFTEVMDAWKERRAA